MAESSEQPLYAEDRHIKWDARNGPWAHNAPDKEDQGAPGWGEERQMLDEVNGMMARMPESRPAPESTVRPWGFPVRAAQHQQGQNHPAK